MIGRGRYGKGLTARATAGTLNPHSVTTRNAKTGELTRTCEWSFRGARPITTEGCTPQVHGLEMGVQTRVVWGLRAGSLAATLLVCAAFRLDLCQ